MAEMVPVLLGTAGMVDRECFLLARGVDVVIGRSRSCDISLRRTSAYLKTPVVERDNDHDLNTVSRRHLRINIVDHLATVQDLSTNGSFLNGEPLRQPQKIDLQARACTLRLGTRESFQLLLLPKDDPRIKNLQPVGSPGGKEQSDHWID
jgi:pSer/pThr/pTyr-binding forkhead associated (FHA) protein